MQIETNIKENTADKKHRSVSSKLLSFKASKLRDGFSFIELIVAVAIMAVITSAILFRQTKFSSDILITNMTYEIALSIRQAQVYGISSRQGAIDCAVIGSGCSTIDKYKVGYGVHFESAEDGGRPNFFRDFMDIPTSFGTMVNENTEFNFKYDGINENLSVDPNILAQGRIKQFCASNDGEDWICGPGGDVALDIVFVKPNPDANIHLVDSSGNKIKYSQAKIVIESSLGDKCRSVSVYGSGQISVDNIDAGSTQGGCEELQ